MLGGGVVYHDTLHVRHPQRTETHTEHIIISVSRVNTGETVGTWQQTQAKILKYILKKSKIENKLGIPGLGFNHVFAITTRPRDMEQVHHKK